MKSVTRRSRAAAALTAVVLLHLAACSGGSTTTDELSYQIDQPLKAGVIGARGASVAILVGHGPVTVTEEHRYSGGKPATAHQVEGQTLRLTESGCGDDNARCEVGYTIRMPKAMSADITAEAGAVKLDGVAGDVHVVTQAGAVHSGGYDAFTYDITSLLNGGTNTIVVGVHDPTDAGTQAVGKQRRNDVLPHAGGGIFYTGASGIWQTVWLEPTPAARVTRVDLVPTLSNNRLSVTVHGAGLSGHTVTATVLSGTTQVGTANGGTGNSFSVPVPDAHRWSRRKCVRTPPTRCSAP